MKCYVHNDKDAVGTCMGCGKFICEECNTEINDKNYCEKCVNDLFAEKNKQIEKEQDKNDNLRNQPQTPNVYMNAGGGSGGGTSSSSSSSSSSSGGSSSSPSGGDVHGNYFPPYPGQHPGIYGNYAPPYPRHNIIIHIILFCTTCGIGNWFYYEYVRKQQRKWNRTYYR